MKKGRGVIAIIFAFVIMIGIVCSAWYGIFRFAIWMIKRYS